MYVCMYVRLYYMYVCMYVRMFVCMYVTLCHVVSSVHSHRHNLTIITAPFAVAAPAFPGLLFDDF